MPRLTAFPRPAASLIVLCLGFGGVTGGQDGARGRLARKAEPVEDVAPGKVALKAQPVEDVPADNKPAVPKPDPKKDLTASWKTQSNARILTLGIPAPRGQIVDRHGVPMAQNRVAYYLALNFPHFEKTDPRQILDFARTKIGTANRLLGTSWSLTDEVLLRHYENRRWLPLVFSVEDGMNVAISPADQEKLKALLGDGLFLQPAYLRHYPKETTACHIIGYTGKVRPLPVQPIQDGDPIFEELEGREGLEMSFNSDLTGKPGMINVLFSPEGKELSKEMLRPPVPGHNVVTTLDYNYQNYAESALSRHARNGGAMVIMDVQSGDVLAMASNPGFNLNDFVPGISQAKFTALSSDPKLPLYPRTFRGEYPPASTFKVVVALAGLDSGAFTARSVYDCDASMKIDNRVFHNWAKEGEGPMNVVTAIKRSCNTWFYQAGLDTGADAVTSMAIRMGFGEKTGLPLRAEAKGTVPTNAQMLQRFGHKILGGHLANMSIGQGSVLVTPVQACQAMVALADGMNMPQVRLVKQVQDLNDRVVQAFPIQTRKRVELKPGARDPVVKGMIAVVSGNNGTGARASIKGVQVAGKTGTAQWKISKDSDENRNLAWFTGFLPANNPVYAFAVVYEGAQGEDVSGGKKAAPIVQEVFQKIYDNAPPEDPLLIAAKSKPKVRPGADEDEYTEEIESAPKAKKVNDVPKPQPPPPPEEPKTVKGFFRKLFGR
jgi:penicillin-binding protein 2